MASLLTLASSTFFTSGEAPGLAGEPVGEVVGDGTGLDVADGTGVAGVGLGVSPFGSHAPSTAIEAAKTVDKTTDLLMIFSLFILNSRTHAFRYADIHSRNENGRFFHGQV